MFAIVNISRSFFILICRKSPFWNELRVKYKGAHHTASLFLKSRIPKTGNIYMHERQIAQNTITDMNLLFFLDNLQHGNRQGTVHGKLYLGTCIECFKELESSQTAARTQLGLLCYFRIHCHDCSEIPSYKAVLTLSIPHAPGLHIPSLSPIAHICTSQKHSPTKQ